MRTTTFTEFRNNAKGYFDMVKKGETIEIYRHGMPAALLTPVRKADRAGRSPLKPLKIPGASLSRAILDERDEKK